MKTSEKYKEMGFTELGRGKVVDKHGKEYYPKKATSPLKAIKLMCKECMGSDRRERLKQENVDMVRNCPDPMCPLFDFRMGKNPFLRGNMTEDQKKAASTRMKLLVGQHKGSSVEKSDAC